METARRPGLRWFVVSVLWAALCATDGSARGGEADFERSARRAAPRDAFPVFHNPPMVPASQAAGLRDDDWVIGVTVNGQAKAYPVAVMGVHELGNDTCGGEPIAVSW